MKLIPWQIRDYIEYRKIFGRYPDLKKPKSMNEKVLYRKRHHCNSTYFTMLADKLLVRKYVADTIGEQYLVPLIDCVDSVEEVIKKISRYSNGVIKTNHASRMVYVVPENINEINFKELKTKISKWIKTDYSNRHGELQYKNIKRKILVEQFIGDRNTLPIDFKVHTFKLKDGGFSYVLEVIENRITSETQHTFFVNNLVEPFFGNFKFNEHSERIMEQAIQLSYQLLGELDYARIDWYIIEDKLYFGEVTLTPGAGLDKDIKGELDLMMGNMWNLSLTSHF